MNWVFSWLVAVLITLPVAIQVAEYGNKPVDLVGSDLLIFALVLLPTRRELVIPRGIVLSRLAMVRVAAMATLLYCLALAGTAYAQTSEMGRVFSAVKFCKPIAFVLLGSYLASVMPPIMTLHRIAKVFAVMSLVTVASAACRPGFPRAAWGQFFLDFPVYGYRNSAMTFYGVMVPFVLSAADAAVSRPGRWTLRGIALLTAVIVVSSLSRSSMIVMVIGTAVYLYVTGRIHWPVISAVFTAVLLITFPGAVEALTGNQDVTLWIERLTLRFSQTVESDDPISGRGAIWEHTIDLWAEKPLCGYAFEPFSRYAEYDTSHQQYLEILYKSGVVGAVLYGIVLVASLLGMVHLTRFTVRRTSAWYFLRALLATFVAIMIGNLSQPNLTYSITGNLLFFGMGLTLNKHAAAALVVPMPARRHQPSPLAGSHDAVGRPGADRRSKHREGIAPPRPVGESLPLSLRERPAGRQG